MVKVFYSAPRAISRLWHADVARTWSALSLPWSSVEASEPGAVFIADDGGSQVELRFGQMARPSGEFESDSYKVVLSFLLLSRVVGLDVAYGSVNEPIDLADLNHLRTVIAFDTPIAEFEDHAFDLGLVPRRFRLRHIEAPSSDIDLSI